jgi:hypothetical protein
MKTLPFSSLLSLILCAVLAVNPLYGQAQAPGISAAPAPPDQLQLRVLNANQLQTGARAGSKQALQVEVTDASGGSVADAAVTCRLPETGPTGNFSDGTHAAVAYSDAQGHATLDPIQWGDLPGAVAIRVTASKGAAHAGILLSATVQALEVPVSNPTKTEVFPVQRETTVVYVPVSSPDAPPATATQPIAPPAVSVTKPGTGSVRQPGEIAPRSSSASPAPDKLMPVAVDPAVSITRTAADDAPHSSHAKWYVLALVAVAAGAGAGFAMKGKSSTANTTPTATLSIGTPSVSVGH